MGDKRFPNGWTRGSPIYAQNKDGTRYITDVIAFRNFTTGMKAYTEGGYANGFDFEGNVTFDIAVGVTFFTVLVFLVGMAQGIGKFIKQQIRYDEKDDSFKHRLP
jgi:hypothetical protein